MTHIYKRRFTVRHYELNNLARASHAAYMNYLQEAAIEASTAAGYSLDWYHEQQRQWLIRKLTLLQSGQATYGDELEVTTWVSDIRRVRSNREYELARVADGQVIVRARADWVFVDTSKNQPTRVPADALEAFAPTGDVPDLGVRLQAAQPFEDAYRYVMRRRVYPYELDAARHVNHANYLRWIEDACAQALVEVGLPGEPDAEAGSLLAMVGHETDYLIPAVWGDEVEITSWLHEQKGERVAWQSEIVNVTSGEVLVKDYALAEFVGPEGEGAARPAEEWARVARGPGG